MDVDGGVEGEAPGAGTRAVDVETVRSKFNSGFTLKGLAQTLFSYRDFWSVRPQDPFSHCKIHHAHVRKTGSIISWNHPGCFYQDAISKYMSYIEIAQEGSPNSKARLGV